MPVPYSHLDVGFTVGHELLDAALLLQDLGTWQKAFAPQNSGH